MQQDWQQPEVVDSAEQQNGKIRWLNGEKHQAAIGGIKVTSASGWYAARISGTEDTYKIFAESFKGAEHLKQILARARATVDAALAPVGAGAPRAPR